MAGIDHALEGIPRCALCCGIFRHARCDVWTQTTFVLSMIIPFDDDDSDAVVRQDAQNSPPTFCCYSSAHYFTQRIWDIQNRRHIRAPQREEVTDDGTDHEVHFCERHCESAMPFDVDAMRGQPDDDDDQSALTSFFLSLSLSFFLSLSLSCFLCKPQAPPASLSGVSTSIASFFSLPGLLGRVPFD